MTDSQITNLLLLCLVVPSAFKLLGEAWGRFRRRFKARRRHRKHGQKPGFRKFSGGTSVG